LKLPEGVQLIKEDEKPKTTGIVFFLYAAMGGQMKTSQRIDVQQVDSPHIVFRSSALGGWYTGLAWFQQSKREAAPKKRGRSEGSSSSSGVAVGHGSRSNKETEAGKPPNKTTRLVRFKYQPGFTNAVRRPVFMRDLV